MMIYRRLRRRRQVLSRGRQGVGGFSVCKYTHVAPPNNMYDVQRCCTYTASVYHIALPNNSVCIHILLFPNL